MPSHVGGDFVNGPKDVSNVRSQPYRIAHSKCYDAVDQRIAYGVPRCHNRHEARPAAATDDVCRSCHNASAKETTASKRQCKAGQSGCTACHMPKYEIPGSHFKFTDHFIRIAKPGEPYPI